MLGTQSGETASPQSALQRPDSADVRLVQPAPLVPPASGEWDQDQLVLQLTAEVARLKEELQEKEERIAHLEETNAELQGEIMEVVKHGMDKLHFEV